MSEAMRRGWASLQGQIPANAPSLRADAPHRSVGPDPHLLRIRVRETRDVLFAAPDGHPCVPTFISPRSDGLLPAVVGARRRVFTVTRVITALPARPLARGQGYVVFDVQYRTSGGGPRRCRT